MDDFETFLQLARDFPHLSTAVGGLYYDIIKLGAKGTLSTGDTAIKSAYKAYLDKGESEKLSFFENFIKISKEKKGAIPNNVVRKIISKSFDTHDDLMQKYLAGLLSSSMTDEGDDDRAVTLFSTIEDMSKYELRIHYLLFLSVKHFYSDAKSNLGDETDQYGIFIPQSILLKHIGLTESDEAKDIISFCVQSLVRRGLISPNKSLAKKGLINQNYDLDVTEDGLLFRPTLFGACLFVWAMGRSGDGNNLLSRSFVLPSIYENNEICFDDCRKKLFAENEEDDSEVDIGLLIKKLELITNDITSQKKSWNNKKSNRTGCTCN